MNTSGKNDNQASLAEVNQSVETGNRRGTFRKLLAFMGPAYLVSVGYMDPGNWATDIAGGSQFGYSLLWVLLMSNLMALLLQSLSARLGIVRRMDLAQASRAEYPKAINLFLYVLAEIAIAACDLAEVLGMAIGLQLLFGMPLLWGVGISVLDTFLLMFLINFGIRKMEAFIIALVAIIGISFLIEMFLAKPDMAEVASGFIPSMPSNAALYIAIGIIGATVMPHNLYLHSSLVQTRKFAQTPLQIIKAIRYNVIDSAIALNLAFFVNAGILVLAASTFFRHGMFDVAEIQDAHKFLEPLLGTSLAPTLFAVALIAAGQSSTITGTLAGQIIMEGYLNLRIQPWMRRMITRVMAIIPAFLTIQWMGERATGDLLVLSQVILSLQLGFAVIPLIHFVSDKKKMGEHRISLKMRVLSWLCALIIVGLNAKLVGETLLSWFHDNPDSLWMWLLLLVTAMVGFLLLYIVFQPFLGKARKYRDYLPHSMDLDMEHRLDRVYQKIAVTVDFSPSDSMGIKQAISLGGKESEYILIHVLETAGAIMMGQDIRDMESETDKKNLENYRQQLIASGYAHVSVKLGYGNPKKEIPRLVNEFDADLLVMGAHGHKAIQDLIFGTTVDVVRHRVKIPVFIVRD